MVWGKIIWVWLWVALRAVEVSSERLGWGMVEESERDRGGWFWLAVGCGLDFWLSGVGVGG